jgi:hypothetical protein
LWVGEHLGVGVSFVQTQMLDALVVSWKGQGPVDVAGAKLVRRNDHLAIDAPPSPPES